MSQQRRRQRELEVPVSWARYFPPTEYDANDRRALLIGEMLAVFSSEHGWRLVQHGARQHLDGYALTLDYKLLCAFAKSADLEAAIDMQPEEGLACLSACLFELLFVGSEARGAQLFGEGAPPGHVAVRLFNHPASGSSIRTLKSSLIGKLVTVKGTVVRVSSIKPMVTAMDFVCAKCEQSTRCAFSDGLFEQPTKCGTEGCRGRSFAPDHSSAAAVDWQKVRVQEIASSASSGGNRGNAAAEGEGAEAGGGSSSDGRVPRSVEVELKSDLVDCCSAGDAVTVVAVVKAMSTQGPAKGDGGGGGGGKAQSALFLLYLDAVSVISERRGAGAAAAKPQALPGPQESPQQPFTLRDLQFIVKFSQEVEGDQFRHLVRALCPSIFGNELIKAGLLLALAGGVRKHCADSSKIAIRGDIHVLLVGDPGQGKSQLLMAASAATPRGVYVGANTCTTAGLTVSVVRDAMTGDFAFEAGAMVLADQGVCCVDEFDKMTGDSKSLLVAMEQQEVSVAKAGLVANLPARTTVLAAANPVGGHYNRGKTVQENLKMSSALMSRFDLVFILMDCPDEGLDARLSAHVMALHSGADGGQEQLLLEYPQDTQQPELLMAADSQGRPQRLTLLQRLKACSQDDGPPLPVPLLKKYIAYARKFVHPKVGPEANEVLKSFYLELRKGANTNDGTPVTARQLESLVRLAEARARLELREEVTQDDAEDVVELMKEALHDKFADEYGLLDLRGSGSRGGKSKQAETKRFLEALKRISQHKGEALFSTSELYSAADELELNVPDMGDFIEYLNDQGELLKKGSGVYKLSCAPSGINQGPEGFSGMRKRRR